MFWVYIIQAFISIVTFVFRLFSIPQINADELFESLKPALTNGIAFVKIFIMPGGVAEICVGIILFSFSIYGLVTVVQFIMGFFRKTDDGE